MYTLSHGPPIVAPIYSAGNLSKASGIADRVQKEIGRLPKYNLNHDSPDKVAQMNYGPIQGEIHSYIKQGVDEHIKRAPKFFYPSGFRSKNSLHKDDYVGDHAPPPPRKVSKPEPKKERKVKETKPKKEKPKKEEAPKNEAEAPKEEEKQEAAKAAPLTRVEINKISTVDDLKNFIEGSAGKGYTPDLIVAMKQDDGSFKEKTFAKLCAKYEKATGNKPPSGEATAPSPDAASGPPSRVETGAVKTVDDLKKLVFEGVDKGYGPETIIAMKQADGSIKEKTYAKLCAKYEKATGEKAPTASSNANNATTAPVPDASSGPPAEVQTGAIKTVDDLTKLVLEGVSKGYGPETIIAMTQADGSVKKKTFAKLCAKYEKATGQPVPTSGGSAGGNAGKVEVASFKNVADLKTFVDDGTAKNYPDDLIVVIKSADGSVKEKTFLKLKQKLEKAMNR